MVKYNGFFSLLFCATVALQSSGTVLLDDVEIGCCSFEEILKVIQNNRNGL